MTWSKNDYFKKLRHEALKQIFLDLYDLVCAEVHAVAQKSALIVRKKNAKIVTLYP